MVHRLKRLGLLALIVAAACSDDGTGPEDNIAGGVDLDVLFAAPTQAEVDAIAADWAARTPGAQDIVVERDTVLPVDGIDVRVRVVSHLVDGLRHVGAVISADGAAGPAPVMIYTHGGDGGVRIEDVLSSFPLVGPDASRFVWVVPSFRSESLRFTGGTFTSQGSPSPWDRDVDDALALLDVAFSIEPAADPDNVALLGFSRGAGVGLLMGVRDPRIDRIVAFFGPTDFFDGFVRDVVSEALRGNPRDLPGLSYLDEAFLQPLSREEKTIAEVRLELVRRSVVLFAERLPWVQLHHGTADDIVEVSQAQSLIDAMAALGRAEPEFQHYLYQGGTHNPLTLPGSISRAADFLLGILPATAAR
jgi:dipeptidyl aminopeptidase/acylaminoacyl peptidase